MLFPALGQQEDVEDKAPREIPAEIKDAQLRADIRAMGRMLGQVILQYEGQGEFWIVRGKKLENIFLFCFSDSSS